MDFNYTYTEKEFEQEYTNIYNELISQHPQKEKKCACFLGGQPGSGKSTYYSGHRRDLINYVIIDGDEFRKHHPRYKDIMKYAPDEYAERTQEFLNKINEKLITDLSDEGYNLVIEGTLRNPNVTINTSESLKSKGYETQLVVMGCDAELSWKFTLQRAYALYTSNKAPRLVPFDKYDSIVTSLSDNLKFISNSGTFSNITIVDREGKDIYSGTDTQKAVDILNSKLNIEDWNNNKDTHEQEYFDAKIEILKKIKESRFDLK